MTTSPYKWNDEAIYKEQAIYVPRQKTIATIFEKLRSEKLIYLRSPRGSGKTSLAYLIKDQGQLHGLSQVIYINCCSKVEERRYGNWLDQHINTPSITEFAFVHQGTRPTLIIMDDFQQLFESQELTTDLKAFTDHVILQQDKCNVFLLCLATHGENTLGKNSATPISFCQTKRLGLSFLLFTEEEYHEAITSFTERRNANLGHIISQMDPTFSLYKMTSGHPGFLLWSIQCIEIKFEKMNNVIMESILNYIYSDDFVQAMSNYRTFETLNSHHEAATPEYKNKCEQGKLELKKMIQLPTQTLKVVNKEETDNDEINPAIASFLIKQGILTLTEYLESHVTWSFNYMRIFWLKRLCAELKGVRDITDINEFIGEFLTQIPAQRLSDSIEYRGTEKYVIKNEAFWQNELYRIAVERFGIKNIFPELGNTSFGDGKIDFYINSTRKWMIEFFVGPNKRLEHYQRFNTLIGRYKDFDVNNFQLVNFVFHSPRQILEKYKGLTIVYFNPRDQYRTATLYLFKRKPKSNVDVTGDEWLELGEYETKTIDFSDPISSKTVYLYLFRGNNMVKMEQLTGIPITLMAFQHKVRQIFKEELQSGEDISLSIFAASITNEQEYQKVKDNVPVNVQIV